MAKHGRKRGTIDNIAAAASLAANLYNGFRTPSKGTGGRGGGGSGKADSTNLLGAPRKHSTKHPLPVWPARTATKKRRSKAQVDPVHGVYQKFSTTVRVGKGHKFSKHHSGGGFWKYYDNYSFNMLSNSGEQGVGLLCSVGTYQDMIADGTGPTAPSGTPGNSGFVTQRSMIALNPMQKVTGGAYYTAGTVPLNDVFKLDDIKLEIDMSNFETVATLLDVWVVLSKDDTIIGPQAQWSNGLANTAGPPDNADAVEGSVTAGVYVQPTEGRVTQSFPGQTPMADRTFRQSTKVLAHKSFEFAGDTQVKWSLCLKYNKLVDKVKWLLKQATMVGAPTNFYVKGFTVSLMYRVRAQVTATSKVTGALIPTYAPANIGVVVNRFYKCQTVFGPNRIQTATAMPYIISGGSIADMVAINVVDTKGAPSAIQ